MDIIEVRDIGEWRSWLAEHHGSAHEVWLVIGAVRHAEAVEQALCFGWIDGLRRGPRQRFTPRGPRSSWSALNRERAARMTARGLMTERGQAAIDRAKAMGRWETDVMPADLRALLAANPVAQGHFAAFPPSTRRLILEWIGDARRAQTRARRLATTVAMAEVNARAR
ncbi:YdeI/OmpD-associated family protein [Actinophytocola glycyrrhizae]|uniref:YdeI family protein n=1 Tax=Actinophytocola glycyrrhizae TaxID=2044873 RepID=A0ABV9SE04_9PSEU